MQARVRESNKISFYFECHVFNEIGIFLKVIFDVCLRYNMIFAYCD